MLITISRELGKRLSEALYIPCYDNEIIAMISDEQGLDPDYVARVSESSLQAEYPLQSQALSGTVHGAGELYAGGDGAPDAADRQEPGQKT